MKTTATPEKKRFEFTLYKPIEDKPGYCQIDRNATYKEVLTALEIHLQGVIKNEGSPNTVYDYLDYMNIDFNAKPETEIPAIDWVYCYVVEGSSEGYYFHIEIRTREDKRVNIITGKTLCNKETALVICNEINNFILSSL